MGQSSMHWEQVARGWSARGEGDWFPLCVLGAIWTSISIRERERATISNNNNHVTTLTKSKNSFFTNTSASACRRSTHHFQSRPKSRCVRWFILCTYLSRHLMHLLNFKIFPYGWKMLVVEWNPLNKTLTAIYINSHQFHIYDILKREILDLL